jgi:hypothetical protein
MNPQIKETITIGADPELFFIDNSNALVPSEFIIQGTKTSPKPISENGHFVLNDNVMAEFNIPPSENFEEFYENIEFVKNYLAEKASELNCKLHIKPSGEFQLENLLSAEKFNEFGCEPDLSIYNFNSQPSNQEYSPMRYCGGHVHCGYDKKKYPNIETRIVEMMDLLLAVPSVILDEDTARRSNYGQAGRYRIKNYGLEYRSLSNFWIEHKEYMEFVFSQSKLAITIVMENLDSNLKEDLQEIINNSDKEAAHLICAKYNITLPTIKINEHERAV